MYINTQTLQYPLYEQDIRNSYPNTSFPSLFVPPEGYAWIFPAPPPEHDKITQSVRQITPVLTQLGNWQESWEVVALDAEAIEANQSAALAQTAAVEAARVASLWQAADAYEKAQISGSATALLVVGVLQGLPISIAIKAWIKSIWEVYYIRKANSSTDTDFSSIGPMPYSVPELMAELGE